MACKEESDCQGIPWCRILNRCLKETEARQWEKVFSFSERYGIRYNYNEHPGIQVGEPE